MKTRWKIAVVLLTIATLLSGCFGEKKTVLEEGKQEIKVMYQSKEQFYKKYGNLFNARYPDIDINVISTMDMEERRELEDEEIKKLIEKHKPDVLFLNEKLFASYVQEGKLYSLEEVIARDTFDLTGYGLGIIDSLRAKGNGTLYALVPDFDVSVLYYNRDLFEENHIELPRNKMSWQEVFDLSKRFEGMGSGENRVLGLYQPFWNSAVALNYISDSFALQMFDSKAEKLLIDSDGWKRAVKLTTDAIRSKAVSFPSWRNNSISWDEFITFAKGKAAMTVNGPRMIQWLKAQGVNDINKINWDRVTIPVDPQNPDESPHVQLQQFCAIPADSPNQPAAWEFIKFVNGPEMAKISSRSGDGLLPTRNQVFKEMDEKSTEPFYMLKTTAQTSDFLYRKDVPEAFYDFFQPLLTDALKAIIDNKKTVDEALAELVVQGQDALVKAREAEKKEKSS
ncbi:ABC transporter substrate-binding protein [Paenibacillus popilliae]|uniref:Periplasmic component n=1 Tax=Paenibacillus popilliae ATCC 14706 TaxID=1212764 RepID=M9M081_PAEPP|nr:extracellular solute-binding protein [Paenibacillus popilliae]GAC42119.1 periplasmic component [Paenibacillus popilliae ATCC 14706]